MSYSKTARWPRPNHLRVASRKLKELVRHPFTLIVLIWVLLWLVFYLVTTFI